MPTPLCFVCLLLAGAGAAENPIIPITVAASVTSGDSGAMPLAVTVTNESAGLVGAATFRLTPTEWNGETINLRLLDVRRDGDPHDLGLAQPAVRVPLEISGMASYPIAPGAALTITTDVRKWTIVGGWAPGRYEARVRVEGLTADGGRCVLGVHSAPFTFDVRAAPAFAPRPEAPPVLTTVDQLRVALINGSPTEKAHALDEVRELQALRLTPEVIDLIADPTPLPREGDTGWGFVGHQAAAVVAGIAATVDPDRRSSRETRAYSFHEDQYRGGAALYADGRLDEVRANWAAWWASRGR